MENLPLFNYVSKKPTIQGSARTTTVKFYPQGFSNFSSGVAPGSYVKFDFSTTGFWDPKSSYIHLEVQPEDINQASNTIFQIDNSAESIFSQLIIRHNGVELERLNNYDSMCAMLYDMNVGTGAREYMDLQGMGKFRNGYYSGYSAKGLGVVNTTKTFPSTVISGMGAGWTQNAATYQVTPTISPWRPYLCSQIAQSNGEASTNTTGQTSGQMMNYALEFATESNEGIQLSHSFPASNVNYAWCGFQSLGVNQWGYTQPYSEACVGCGEPWMTSGPLSRLTIASGWGCYKKPQVLTFAIPIMSPIWGPMSRHGKLLPMALFQGLEFEFLINPYAFTVHNIPSALDHTSDSFNTTTAAYNGTQNPANVNGNRTKWKINSFTINTEIINFDSTIEDAIIEKTISNGFDLSFDQWFECSKTKYDSSQQLNTTIQVNHAFESLKMLTLRACPADYETYSWSRKHQYISMNLTSMQLRIGTEYVPSSPIIGHCGNIRNDIEGSVTKSNYVEFFINTMKAWGKFFDMRDSTLLNPTNYTMNCTGFDPSSIVSANAGNLATSLTQGALNGMTLFHNNRAVPRNIISFDCERFDILQSVNSGINTINNRPFDILITNDTGTCTYNVGQVNPNDISGTSAAISTAAASNFNRPFYLSVWALYAARLMYVNGQGWVVRGRA